MSLKKSYFSGSFYPNSKDEILKYINFFNHKKSKLSNYNKIKALIVPHAGYVYSGFTANLAYLFASKFSYKNIIVIGPSHKVAFEGASVLTFDEYETPLGNIQINKDLSSTLINSYDFLDFNVECEFEHSTEVQMPFIKHYFPNSKVVEIIYSKISFQYLSKLISDLLSSDDNLVVISSDLSHFYTKTEAMKLDNVCLNAIQNKDLKLFDYCEACGKTGLKAVVDFALNSNFDTKLLYYCTSADFSKDENKVVGYASAIVGE